MSIYDVPVHDTKFFPVSGDMMRQMTTDQKNDTGDSAKNPSDAVYSITQKGKQAMLHVSISHDDLVVHPIWCDPNLCIPADPTLPDDRPLHQSQIGYIEVAANEGVDVCLVAFPDEAPQMLVGDATLPLSKLEDLILLLGTARKHLIYAGGVR